MPEPTARADPAPVSAGGSHGDLMAWRRRLRSDLLQQRMATPTAQLTRWRRAIDSHLELGFPRLGRRLLGFCWPIRNEYDPRHLLRKLRAQGAQCALPVVQAPGVPLLFRVWRPGAAMKLGALDIPYPASGEEVIPDALLIPMNGFDRQGHRLGYGGGFFDRTLAKLRDRPPLAIGVSFELAAIPSIDPQSWDMPMDYVVTERGLYRRDGTGGSGQLEFLGVPRASEVELASPVCYAEQPSRLES